VTNAPDSRAIWADLRAHDPNRFLTALFTPRHARADLMALYAFNTELARIPELVSEPELGEFRLQWWRDTLGNMANGVSSGAPVADALGVALRKHDLSDAMLLGMIDARSADLDGGGFADLQALKAYLYKSQGAVFALGAHVLGGSGGDTARAANAAGLAYGLAELLRNLPRDAAAGRVMAPLSLLKEHGLKPEQLLAGEGGDAVLHLVAELAREAGEALDAARGEVAHCDRSVRCVFAPLKLVEPILAAVQAPGHNPLRDIAEINPLLRYIRLWRAARSGRV